MPKPDYYWNCAECGHGPMAVGIDEDCRECGTRRNSIVGEGLGYKQSHPAQSAGSKSAHRKHVESSKSWWCEECGHGPMTIAIDAYCVSCAKKHRQETSMRHELGSASSATGPLTPSRQKDQQRIRDELKDEDLRLPQAMARMLSVKDPTSAASEEDFSRWFVSILVLELRRNVVGSIIQRNRARSLLPTSKDVVQRTLMSKLQDFGSRLKLRYQKSEYEMAVGDFIIRNSRAIVRMFMHVIGSVKDANDTYDNLQLTVNDPAMRTKFEASSKNFFRRLFGFQEFTELCYCFRRTYRKYCFDALEAFDTRVSSNVRASFLDRPVSFRVDWKIHQFVDSYGEELQDLKQCLVITGDPVNAQMTTIGSYLEQTWPHNPDSIISELNYELFGTHPAEGSGVGCLAFRST